MTELVTRIYTTGDQLPDRLMEDNYFHSPQLFALCKDAPRHRPYMVTVETTDGRIVSQMLTIVRRRVSWLPPYLFRQCRILSEGAYAPDEQLPLSKDQLFGMMLTAWTRKFGPSMLYIEVSNLSQKMFGYKQFRDNRFFPVRWMSIHNSLHSKTPEERISKKKQKRIDRAYQRGAITEEVKTDDDLKAFFNLLKHHNWLKPKRFIPNSEFFLGMRKQGNTRLFITRYKDHIIGCSAVVYSQRQAYLWYAAYRRKSFAFVHPDELTIWHVIKDAHERGFEHIYFMDVGLPYSKNSFRDFILGFGGKPDSTYRWFRCSLKWINSLLSWIYRD